MSEQSGAGGTESSNRLWAIVLAGGQGVRLRRLARGVCGEERPKQYVPLLGARTLLRQTLDRVWLAIAPERTVVVTVWDHARYLAAEDASAWGAHLLVQPDSRGTAAGILFPAHWVSWRVPDATVAVFPSDHFVQDEAVFMAHIAEVAAWVERHPERVVLVGAHPRGPEMEYGWIEPGEPLGAVSSGPICAVGRFLEKPSEETARSCLASGWMWNTLVVVAKVATLLEVGQERLPELSKATRRHRGLRRDGPRGVGGAAGVCPDPRRQLLALDPGRLPIRPGGIPAAARSVVRSRDPATGFRALA